MDPALLQPSIRGSTPSEVYSPRATFFTAFLGGTIAAVLIHGLNAKHFDRWDHERWPLAGALVVAVGVVVGAAYVAVARPDLLAALPEELGRGRLVRWGSRLIALVLWGVLYLRMRENYRAAEMQAEYRPAWRAGLACVAIGTLVSLVVVGAVTLVAKAT